MAARNVGIDRVITVGNRIRNHFTDFRQNGRGLGAPARSGCINEVAAVSHGRGHLPIGPGIFVGGARIVRAAKAAVPGIHTADFVARAGTPTRSPKNCRSRGGRHYCAAMPHHVGASTATGRLLPFGPVNTSLGRVNLHFVSILSVGIECASKAIAETVRRDFFMRAASWICCGWWIEILKRIRHEPTVERRRSRLSCKKMPRNKK